MEQIGPLAYRLALPLQLANVHNVFHLSMLRKYIPDLHHVIDYQCFKIKEHMLYRVACSYLGLERKDIEEPDHSIREDSVATSQFE